MKIKKILKNNKGFSLVEVSIAMLVFGIMLGMSIKGYSLVQKAHLIATVEQINQYKIGVRTYTDMYGSLPGFSNNQFDETKFWKDLASENLSTVSLVNGKPKLKIGNVSVEMSGGELVMKINGLTAKQAQYIDNSIDDGNPHTGDILSTSEACVAGDKYNLSKTENVCEITIKM